jgi:hypothetical protein
MKKFLISLVAFSICLLSKAKARPAFWKGRLLTSGFRDVMNANRFLEATMNGVSFWPLLRGRLTLTLFVMMAIASKTLSNWTQAILPSELKFVFKVVLFFIFSFIMISARMRRASTEQTFVVEDHDVLDIDVSDECLHLDENFLVEFLDGEVDLVKSEEEEVEAVPNLKIGCVDVQVAVILGEGPVFVL